MKENNLLASVALFSELYNNEKYTDVTDILAEFIKATVCIERKWSITSTELVDLLEKNYDFKIPESVVRTTLKHRLKGIATIKDGYYHFDNKIEAGFNQLNNDYNTIADKQNRIFEDLTKYIELHEGSIDTNEKAIIAENFQKFLLDNGVSDKYSKYISAFIITNQHDQHFTDSLNLVKEGLILYQGIKYTADINELGKWNTELTIFLSTEHLFNALGYNGELFYQIFNDFYGLVTEINISNKRANDGRKLIELQYFEETKDEIETFFHTAELILKGTIMLDPSRPAMKKILEGCKTLSDIRNKKIKFEQDLKNKGIIVREFKNSIYKNPNYVVEDESILEELKRETESIGRTFDSDMCRQFFKIFTKINYFRKGDSKTKFEKIGHIFITGNRFALYLSHNDKVKFDEDDIPFAKDIDYITSKLWFKLKKGFSNKSVLPKSFNVITKAQIILSSQISQSIYNEYQKLQKEVRDGLLTKEEAISRSYELRVRPNKPEEITLENIDTSLDFLNNDAFFEDLSREREKKEILFHQVTQENEELKNILRLKEEAEVQQKKIEEDEEKELKISKAWIPEWKKIKKKQNKDTLYFVFVTLLECLPIIIGFILRQNSTLYSIIESWGNYQYLVWTMLIVFFIITILGRSYLFNKERIQRGWTWIQVRFVRKRLVSLKEEKYKEFKSQF